MVVLGGGGAISYERGTPVSAEVEVDILRRKLTIGRMFNTAGVSEAGLEGAQEALRTCKGRSPSLFHVKCSYSRFAQVNSRTNPSTFSSY